MGSWNVEEWRGDASGFHARDLPSDRRIWAVSLTGPALVLGSAQPLSDVDFAAATGLGLQVVSRRTGGGAVWLDPDASVWVDVTIPRGDPLWNDDVSVSALWLGRAFATVVSPEEPAEVYEGRYTATAVARALCFAGLAPGEVTRQARKVVGVSQRRTRDGARFQCVAYRRWDTGAFAAAFSDPVIADAARALEVGTIGASAQDLALRLATVLPA